MVPLDHQLCKTGQFRFCGKMENQGEIQRKKCIVKLCVEGIAESGAGDRRRSFELLPE